MSYTYIYHRILCQFLRLQKKIHALSLPCHIPGGMVWCDFGVCVGVLWVVVVQAGVRILGKSKLITKVELILRPLAPQVWLHKINAKETLLFLDPVQTVCQSFSSFFLVRK